MSEWISVNDRLPEIMARVLLHDKDGFGTVTGRLQTAGWYLENVSHHYCNITHWMPLPEPPKTEPTPEIFEGTNEALDGLSIRRKS